MPEVENDSRKRPADGEEPEPVKLRAFAECGFALWYERVPKDFLVGWVANHIVRWQAIGANVPQLAQALVWEEVTHTRYDPKKGKFVLLHNTRMKQELAGDAKARETGNATASPTEEAMKEL